MALIICEECGKEYSDKAGACPNCGCPTPVKVDTSKNVRSLDDSFKCNKVAKGANILSYNEMKKTLAADEDVKFATIVSSNNNEGKRISYVLAITDKRVLLVSNLLGKVDIRQIPNENIQSVDSSKFMTTKITVKGMTDTFDMGVPYKYFTEIMNCLPH